MAQGKRGGKKAGGRQNAHKGLPVDMEDDVDIFHKQRDRVALAPEVTGCSLHSFALRFWSSIPRLPC